MGARKNLFESFGDFRENRGTIISFEGISKIGKSVQVQTLFDNLRENGFTSEAMEYPLLPDRIHDSKIYDLLTEPFESTRNRRPDIYYLLSAANRIETEMELHRACASNDVIILDTYMYSSIAYATAWTGGRFSVETCLKLEEQLRKPDIVIYLKATSDPDLRAIAKRGMANEEQYSKTELNDKTEWMVDFLKRVECRFQQIKEEEGNLAQWLEIPITFEDSPESTAEHILNTVKTVLKIA